jgi:hypothetical protein
MSQKTSSRRELGCLAPAVGIAGLVATLMLGPIDLGRSVYNQIIGDTPILKRELLDYSRRDILNVSIEKLWDASEDHARSLYQRWVWPSLDQ